jgi:para-nitrobenzyl esterase
MLWIHGGAWVSGSGEDYDGSVLAAKEDVIVVTINYRIGALGYLANSSVVSAAPQDGAGAFATLDQIEALQWARQSIAAFGGDPHNVTIFGESGGGFAICQLLFAPQAAGLFHLAITESGPCGTARFATLATALQTGDKFASNLGCSGGGPSVVACLRQASVDQILAASPPPTITTGATWTPVIDGVVMPKPSIDALATGSFNRVPVLEGTNHDEATIFSPTFLNGLDLSNPADLATYDAVIATIDGPAPVSQINAEYPPSSYKSPFYSYSAAAGDFYFSCPAYSADQQLSRHVHTFAYEFNDPNVPDFFGFPLPLLTYHGSELVFVFGTPASEYTQLSQPEQELSDQIMAYWTSFARQGKPTAVSHQHWPRYQPMSSRMLNLTPGGVAPYTGFASDHHCDFWEPLLYPAGQ